MQAFTLVFLAIYLAHLLTDFVFQSSRQVARGKARRSPMRAMAPFTWRALWFFWPLSGPTHWGMG